MSYCAILCQKSLFLVDLCLYHKPYHVKNRPCLVRSDRCIASLPFLWNFVNGLQTPYVNSGCLRCFSNMNVSSANNTLLNTLFDPITVSFSKEFPFLIDSMAFNKSWNICYCTHFDKSFIPATSLWCFWVTAFYILCALQTIW